MVSRKGLNTPEEVLLGVQHILAETIARGQPMARAIVRVVLWDTGKSCVRPKSEKLPEGSGTGLQGYFSGSPSRFVISRRIASIAINRGEGKY